MHTVRPVKRVDAAGSLRNSAEYVGSARSPPLSPKPEIEAGTSGSGKSNNSSGKLRKRSKEETANAGRLLVDQVVLPTLQKVCAALFFSLSL